MKVCFVAQFPPPIHGLSKAVDTLYNSRLRNKYNFTKINITNNRLIIINLVKLLFSRADYFYLTVSQSRGGNLRDLCIMMLLRITRKRYGVHVHGGLHFREVIYHGMPMWQRKLNIHLLSEVSFAISLSESLRPNFIDIVPEKRIWVIENGVSKDNVPSESEFRVTLTERLNKSVKQVLFLSNLIESKGYRKVLEVAAIERKRIVSGEKQRLKFDFAGAFFDVSERNFFESFVREKKLEDFVTYHGVVKGDKKKQLLQNASIFCLPTWYPVEGQPISMLEAMANGEYIISTKHAAIPDIITSECNGILYDHDVDAVQMHKDMTRLSDAKLEKASNSNRACFFRRYTETKYVDKFDSLFTVLENGL